MAFLRFFKIAFLLYLISMTLEKLGKQTKKLATTVLNRT